MKAKISKWGEELLANPINAYALAKAIISQGEEAMKNEEGVIEFEAVITTENGEEKKESVKLISATSSSLIPA